MQRKYPFLGLLLILSVIIGYLLSKASLIGRAGINLFYKEYQFLKVWWQGGGVVLIAFLLLFTVQGMLEKRLPKSGKLHLIALVLALVGLYFTYYDFRHTLTHRLLGERFHLGGYLFWIGWMLISLFYLTVGKAKREVLSTEPVDHTK